MHDTTPTGTLPSTMPPHTQKTMKKNMPLKPLHVSAALPRSLVMGALVLLISAYTPPHAHAEPLVLEEEEELEYIDMEEILARDEAPAAKAKSVDTAPEDTFVDMEALLKGTTNPAETQRIRQAEARVTQAPTRQSLDAEMQSLKQKVVNVNRDLSMLAEDLLSPANTQVNVFVSLDAGELFQPDAITLTMNDKAIVHHLYTTREVSALQRGAVQRLYVGHLNSGEHELLAMVTGIGPDGREYRRAVNLAFDKDTGTKFIELKIQGDKARQQPTFRFKEWE